jgi:hypothetical protein
MRIIKLLGKILIHHKKVVIKNNNMEKSMKMRQEIFKVE